MKQLQIRPWSSILKEAMISKNISPAALQKKTSIPWATLSDWMNKENARPMINQHFRRVVIILGITKRQILEIK